MEILGIVRFSLLVPGTLAVTLFVFDQMTGAPVAATENVWSLATLAFVGAALFAALIVSYTARTMLRFQFAGRPISDAGCYRVLRRHRPRLFTAWVAVFFSCA